MTTEKLLACPFCGCKAVWFKTGRDIGIECEDGFDCPGRAQTNVYAPEHRQDVIAEWNRRVLPTGEDIRDLFDTAATQARPASGEAWISVDHQRPMLEGVGEEDVDVWTWDGKSVREDTYGLIFEQPAGPVIGGWVCTGEGFGNDDAGTVTHWMLRATPAAPTSTPSAAKKD